MKTRIPKNLSSVIALILFLGLTTGLFAQPTPEWIKSYNNNLENKDDYAIKSVIDAQGNTYVTGDIRNGDFTDIVTIKYDANGNLQWQRTYGYGSKSEQASDILTDNSGNVYVVGNGYNLVSGMDILLLKYNQTGGLEFAKRITKNTFSDRSSYALSMVLGNNGLWIGCTFMYNGGFNEIGMARYSTNGDSIAYNSLATRFGVGSLWMQKVTKDASGNIYAAAYGKFNANEDLDMGIYKFNYNAVFEWGKTYSGASHGADYAYDIKVGPDQNVFVSGSSFQNNQGNDCMLLKYGRDDGSVIWEKRFNNSAANQDDYGFYLTFDNNSNIIVSGKTKGINTQDDFLTIKYSPSGSMVWNKIYNTNNNDGNVPAGIVCDNSGNIYIVGDAERYSDFIVDFVTLKYSAAGELDWKTTYTGASNFDRPKSINIDNGGSIIVSGSYKHATTEMDIITIKYGSTIGIQQISNEVPSQFQLNQNYPNPFNPTTNISFSIPKPGNVKLVVFDISGREVAQLVDEDLKEGRYNFDFNAAHLSSGVYFYKLFTNDFTEVKKMILVK